MACITHIRHILRRDGVNQFDRLPIAFDPSYVKIDEKTNDDLLMLIKNFSKHVQYYNINNLKEGDWQVFFDDFGRKHEPHIALMLTFLKLFQEARNHLNELGKSHLDFYYRQFLQIKHRAAVPDKVHLVIETAKGINQYKLAEGTKFLGGKDQSGKPLIYQSERETILNKASIGELKSVFVDRSRQNAIYAAQAANSADGNGSPFDITDQKWPAFGAPQSGLPVKKRTMSEAATGFAIASPLFRLKEGERIITLAINLKELTDNSGLTLQTLFDRELNNTLVASLTGEEGWTENFDVDIVYNRQAKQLMLTILIPKDAPAIIAYDNKLHPGAFNVEQPTLRITTKHHPGTPPYNWLRSLRFLSINITVSVKELRSLTLANELGKLDGDKPFQPFGPSPAVGAAFYIGCNELFSKKISAINLKYKWKDIPTSNGGFSDHYKNYGTTFSNEGFSFLISALNKSNWTGEQADIPHKLFHLREKRKSRRDEREGRNARDRFSVFLLKDSEVSHSINVSDLGFEQQKKAIPALRYEPSAKTGFLRMELSGQDFGHKLYPSALATQSVKMAKALMDNPDASPPKLPNPPYTPVMEYLALDYTGVTVVDEFSGAETDGNTFFHIYPFGEGTTIVEQDETGCYLTPHFDRQGYFYIGIKDFSPPQQLSILFQIAGDSADPAYVGQDQKITWSYLTKDGWEEFKPGQIVSDATNNFLKTGIIIFDFPTGAVRNNPAMPAGMHWLCAACNGDVRGINQMIALYAQALTAVFADQGNDPSHYATPLTHESITKLLNQEPAVKKIAQPFSSFGGRMPETGMNYPIPYYTRVSERLRHKNRAVTLWDIERLVLGHFPNIYKVKALSHSNDRNDIAPGSITVLAIEKIRNRNAVNPLQPSTGRNTLTEIKNFLKRHVSPFVEVFVQNPIYEEVQVSFNVAFMQGYDAGYYKTRLNDDIRQFLSPWAYEDGEDIVFGNVIYKSAIQYFVEKRKYVDYVTGFTMWHTKPNWGIGCMEILHDFIVGEDDTLVDIDKAEPKTSRSIIVSSAEHKISIIENTN